MTELVHTDLQVIEVFRDLQKEGLDPSATSYTQLMRAYQNAGSATTAVAAHAEALETRKSNTVAMNLLVDILARGNNMAGAADIVTALAEAAESDAPGRPVAQELLPAFGALASGYRREKDCHSAVALLRQFNALGGVPDQRLYDGVLRACLLCAEVCPVRSCSAFTTTCCAPALSLSLIHI